MRPLVFLPSVEVGGCEIFSAALVERLHERFPQLAVCMPRIEAIEQLSARFDLPGSRRLNWLTPAQRAGFEWGSFVRQFQAGAHILDRANPDFVVLVLPAPESALGFLAACAALDLGGVCIFQLASEVVQRPLRHLLLAREALAKGMQPVAVSNHNLPLLAESFRLAPSRFRVIQNASGFSADAIDREAMRHAVRSRHGLAETGQLVVTVARLTPQKGYDLLLSVARKFYAEGRQATFLWLGEGELRDDLAAQTRDLPNVVMTGRVEPNQVRWYLGAADLFVLPSRHEGTPLALSEAMSLSVPIVASGIGSIREMITPAEAFLFRPGDAASLDEALRQALDRPADAQAMARAALARYRAYDKVDMLDCYMELMTLPRRRVR